MKKMKKVLLRILCILIICWLAMFMTDFIRSRTLHPPIFAYQLTSADDGGSGTYQGLGYKVEVKKYMDINFGAKTAYVKMCIFGKVIVYSNE